MMSGWFRRHKSSHESEPGDQHHVEREQHKEAEDDLAKIMGPPEDKDARRTEREDIQRELREHRRIIEAIESEGDSYFVRRRPNGKD